LQRLIKYTEPEEDPEIGKQRVHGKGRIAACGQQTRKKMLSFIQKISQDTVESQQNGLILQMFPVGNNMVKESINLVTIGRYRNYRPRRAFDFHFAPSDPNSISHARIDKTMGVFKQGTKRRAAVKVRQNFPPLGQRRETCLRADPAFAASSHPETPDEKLLVSDSESGDLLSWQGNQGIARRRTEVRCTSKPAD
jgi:hypothetical protein